MKKISTFKFFQLIAFIVVLAGATGSLYFVFRTGHNQKSILLIALFTAWVLSPFIALLIVNFNDALRLIIPSVTLYSLMVGITLFSLVIYTGAFNLQGTKPAFKFLVVPLISWLFIGVILLVYRYLSRRIDRSNNYR